MADIWMTKSITDKNFWKSSLESLPAKWCVVGDDSVNTDTSTQGAVILLDESVTDILPTARIVWSAAKSMAQKNGMSSIYVRVCTGPGKPRAIAKSFSASDPDSWTASMKVRAQMGGSLDAGANVTLWCEDGSKIVYIDGKLASDQVDVPDEWATVCE